jgi:hypothetical protein
MEGEGEEKGMEGVKGLERGRRGLDEVREGNKGLATERNREVRNEKRKIRTKRGVYRRRDGCRSGTAEGGREHRSGAAWGGGAVQWEAFSLSARSLC